MYWMFSFFSVSLRSVPPPHGGVSKFKEDVKKEKKSSVHSALFICISFCFMDFLFCSVMCFFCIIKSQQRSEAAWVGSVLRSGCEWAPTHFTHASVCFSLQILEFSCLFDKIIFVLKKILNAIKSLDTRYCDKQKPLEMRKHCPGSRRIKPELNFSLMRRFTATAAILDWLSDSWTTERSKVSETGQW